MPKSKYKTGEFYNKRVVIMPKKKYKIYECQGCGELIGIFGRIFQFFFGKHYHKCERKSLQ